MDSKRIVRNTSWLYLRMLFILLVSLYTSRIVLGSLGVVDFGIYNVVGGVVLLLGFLKSTLSGATSRYLSYEIGRGDQIRISKTFVSSLVIHLLLSLVAIAILESAGLWFVCNKLQIPINRLNVAIIVYHISVFTSVANMMHVPFNALVISYERMNFFAIVGIVDSVVKLIIAYLLSYSSYDRLLFYSTLLLIESLFVLGAYVIYCKKSFATCSLKLKWYPEIVKPLFSFSGWDLYGNFSVVVRSHGLNILQNMFFGPIVNAATAISNQVMAGVMGFADNFLTAVKPQIIKTYAQKRIDDFNAMILLSSKYSFILLMVVSSPVVVETEYVLSVWLVNVPQWATEFVRLSIINNWISIIFRPVIFGVHATGNAKRISLINGTIYILVLPLSYLALRLGASPIMPFIINIILLLFGHTLFSMYTIKHYVPQFNIKVFLRNTILKAFFLSLIIFIPSLFINEYFQMSLYRFLLNTLFVILFSISASWIIIMNVNERRMMLDKIKRLKLRK